MNFHADDNFPVPRHAFDKVRIFGGASGHGVGLSQASNRERLPIARQPQGQAGRGSSWQRVKLAGAFPTSRRDLNQNTRGRVDFGAAAIASKEHHHYIGLVGRGGGS